MGCKVEDLLGADVPSLEEGTSVQEATRLMAMRNVGSCVVTCGGQAVGLFTERNLLVHVVAQGCDPAALSLGEICSRRPVSVDHQVTCRQALIKMRSHQCQWLLVYRGQRFLGLVKLTDLAYALASRGPQTNMLVNAIGGATMAVAVGVIVLLMIQLPNLLGFLGQGRAH
jgi:signal-transduction protein with cAMP-binding, CBS, and nucleotidyltransferase domain